MKIKIKNLDEVYSTIKSITGELTVTGWSAQFERIIFNESASLLGWFIKNIATLKQGCKNLLVANACGDGNGYTIYEDSLLISSEKTELGFLIILTKEYFTDNGYHDFSGRYEVEGGKSEITFLLKCE
jgi:hypothetical protein